MNKRSSTPQDKDAIQDPERSVRWLKELRGTKIVAGLIVLTAIIGGVAQFLGGVNSLIVESEALLSRIFGSSLNATYE